MRGEGEIGMLMGVLSVRQPVCEYLLSCLPAFSKLSMSVCESSFVSVRFLVCQCDRLSGCPFVSVTICQSDRVSVLPLYVLLSVCQCDRVFLSVRTSVSVSLCQCLSQVITN